MERKLLVCRHAGHDALKNLAGEKWLMDKLEEGCDILYLWQNDNCVVIGRNQNVWSEVNVGAAMEHGTSIVRRLSGGGAVYHDLGNLNFTFITQLEHFDIQSQTEMVLEAVRSLGIEAEMNGRNDLCTLGRKFSGHSYHIEGDRAFHNGTILLDADAGIMAEVLNPERSKLLSKGVESVRSRTVNLCGLIPGLNPETVSDALEEAFKSHYASFGYTAIKEDGHYSGLLARFSSREWIYNKRRDAGTAIRARFPWGGVEIYPEWTDDVISDCAVYTDALDHDAALKARAALIGRRRDEIGNLDEDKILEGLFHT